MGLGPTITVGFLDANGEWVAVSADNPLPAVASTVVEELANQEEVL